MPRTISPSPSGRLSRFFPFGISALNPFAISGVTIMKMINSTSMMSIIGMTFGSDLTEVWPARSTDVATAAHRLLGLELLGEDRAAEFAPDALDEVVDELLRGVRHLDRQVLDLGGEVIVEPHRGDRHEEAERRGDEGLGDTARDAREAAGGAARAHGGEGVHDAHRRAQEADERGGRADGGDQTQTALELREHDEHHALGVQARSGS